MTNRSRHLPAAVLGAALLLLQAGTALAAEGDPAKGKQIFAKCQVCHSIEKGVNKIGPSLHGVYGRKAGTLEGYNYTDAMKNSGFTWDETSLGHISDQPAQGRARHPHGLRRPAEGAGSPRRDRLSQAGGRHGTLTEARR